MSTPILKSKAFQKLLEGNFPLPASASCSWFVEREDEHAAVFRDTVRAFCKLGTAAAGLLGEAVEHQHITRKAVSKMVENVENLGLVIVRDGDAFLNISFTILPTLAGEDVMLAVDELVDSLAPPVFSTEKESSHALSP